jgi:hypothetical protein
MQPFKSYILNEGFVNLIGQTNNEARKKYAPQVWDLLQKAYQKIGGIAGSGFASQEDMIINIPFWKLYLEGEQVKAVAMYKDKGGRKLVAVATDQSKKGLSVLADIGKSSLGISFGEYSKGALVFIVKTVGFDRLKPYLISPSQVKSIISDNLTIPTQEFVDANLEKSDRVLYKAFPKLRPYFYVRTIGEKPYLKISIGTPNISITNL